MEASLMPINRQVDKKAVVHIHSGILLSHKKNELLLFAMAWMDLESITLNEMSEKDIYHMISLICRIQRTK